MLTCVLVAMSMLLTGCLRWVATDSAGVFRWHEVPSPNFYVGLALWSAMGVWGYWKYKAKGCLVTAVLIVSFMMACAFFASTFVLGDEAISHTGFLKKESVRWADVQEVRSFESSSTDAKMSLATGRRVDTEESEKHIGVFFQNAGELRIPMDKWDSALGILWPTGIGYSGSSPYDQEQLKKAILKRLPADVRARSAPFLEQQGVPDPGDR